MCSIIVASIHENIEIEVTGKIEFIMVPENDDALKDVITQSEVVGVRDIVFKLSMNCFII